MKIVVSYLKLKYLFQLVKNEIIDFILFGKIKRKVVDRIDYAECEVEYRGRFNKVVGYYAYGFYESDLPYPRNREKLKDGEYYNLI